VNSTSTYHGKVIVITGASSGIGRETALAAGRRGASVVAAARRIEKLRDVIAEIEVSGGKAIAVETDVSREADVKKMITAAADTYQRIDVLVNNAGAGLFAPVAEITSEQMERIWRTNFMGTFYAIREVLPIMQRQKTGHIITIASMAGKRATPLNAAYCSTKFAQIGFMESLRTELSGTEIRCSVVYPGPTDTEFLYALENPGKRAVRYYGPVQTAEKVAAAVLKVIERPKAEVYTQGYGRAIVILNTLMPGFIDWIVRKRVKRKLFEQEVTAKSPTDAKI
jgi:short-subunit dehydrogenase